jgi:hypothetical protein
MTWRVSGESVPSRTSVTDQIRHSWIKGTNLVRVNRQLVFHPNRPLTSKAILGVEHIEQLTGDES